MLVWQAHKARIRQMAFSPDGAELATTAGSSKFVWRWHATTGEALDQLKGHAKYARAVAYSPDGRFVASTENGPATRIWDRATGELFATLGTGGWCRDSLAFRPDSLVVAVASDGIGEWAVAPSEGRKAAKPVSQFDSRSSVHRVLYSPCGRYFAVIAYRDLVLYDAVSHERLRSLHDPRVAADATHFAFAPDGNTLAVVHGLRIRLRKMPDGEETVVLRGHPNYIHAVGFMPAGRTLLSAGADGVVRVWNATTGEQVRSFDWGIGKVCAAAIAPNGMLCAAGGENGAIVVWDVDE